MDDLKINNKSWKDLKITYDSPYRELLKCENCRGVYSSYFLHFFKDPFPKLVFLISDSKIWEKFSKSAGEDFFKPLGRI